MTVRLPTDRSGGPDAEERAEWRESVGGVLAAAGPARAAALLIGLVADLGSRGAPLNPRPDAQPLASRYRNTIAATDEPSYPSGDALELGFAATGWQVLRRCGAAHGTDFSRPWPGPAGSPLEATNHGRLHQINVLETGGAACDATRRRPGAAKLGHQLQRCSWRCFARRWPPAPPPSLSPGRCGRWPSAAPDQPSGQAGRGM